MLNVIPSLMMSRKVCVNEVDKTYPDLFYVRKIIFLYRLCSVAWLPKHLQTRASQNFLGGKSDFDVTCPSGNWRKSLSSSTV